MVKRWLGVMAVCVGLMSGCKSREGASSESSKGSGGQKTSDAKGAAGGNDTSEQGERDNSVPVDTVKIDAASQQRVGIRLGTVEVRRVPRQLTVAGQVVPDERHTDHIGALADGRIERVMKLPGDSVRAGETMALLHSHSVHETVGALAQAYAAQDRQSSAVKFSELNRDRYRHLLELKVASEEEAQRAEQELRQAQQNLADAQASVRMEREHLSELLQVSPESLSANHLYDKELVPVRAVSAGTVMTRSITPGQVVSMGAETFVVSNLSTVWVTASVNEKDLASVRVGERAKVTTQGLAGEELPARVAMVGDQIDPTTRTVPVRVSVPNAKLRLRPGMFATVAIDEAESRPAVYVPETAVQDVNGIQAVFVTRDGSTFQVRAVKLGAHAGGEVEATEGLAAGDRVVVDGAFGVKAELLKGSVGEG